ncbi:GcvT family protein [Leekyejoonella antrihumi]|uniref:FAD-dependent oxidoreductase n=1 Tax=Leekyejoonella antrihumi TaxID=1660198 RepID=A0A563DZ29_9MICO|nr:FAD-dependent oxidoreductase [Leekyejoonella antrihumi]TWP35487.1 FAD-dependent oxidoreductase [Leekyejoonella antrihumi]
MPNPKVVIIGAGVVGAALADELTAKGWTDVTVVDQGDLPEAGGSSSHAPGLVFQASPTKVLTDLARYTVQKFCALEVDGESCFYQVGGLEVATTPERVRELQRRQGWLQSWGVECEMLDAAETVAHHPLLDPQAVLAGLFIATDGLARSVPAVQAQLGRAVSRGARVLARHEVLDVLAPDGAVRAVVTDHGEIAADIVVCCAGIWGPKVAALVGLDLPLTPLGHQLAWTAPVPALAGRTAEATLPILRHQGHDLYFREKFDRIGIGYYGHKAMPMDANDILGVDEADVMPSVLEFTPEDFAPAWRETQALLPATRETEIASGINGLFSFTTDNMPLIGESPQVAGFWVAEAVWVTHSAGVGRAVAELLVDGYSSSFDLHECDLARFEPHQLAPDYVRVRDCRNFDEVYDILHPLQPPTDLRPIRVSPFYRRQQELGAQFLEASGWERPQWYDTNKDLVATYPAPELDEWSSRFWSPIVAAEARVTRERVALYDMTALKRLEVSGRGATDFLQHLVTANIAKTVGGVTYCLMLNVDGGIRSDITVARLATNRYQVGVNGNADLDWMRRHLPADGTVQVHDITPGTCCIGLWGPLAREVLAPLTSMNLGKDGLKYFRSARFYVGTVPVTALRMSYVGELGWELYTTSDHGERLWDLLWDAGQAHGIIAAGRGAFTSLRLEKGYRAYGADMTAEHDPFEAGLGFAVKLDREFIGRDALVQRKEQVTRRLTCLLLPTGTTVVGKEPVLADGKPVGYVTSAAYGHTVDRGVAYAWLPADLATVGTTVEIGYFDQRIPAVVAAEPLVDPDMTRLRG